MTVRLAYDGIAADVAAIVQVIAPHEMCFAYADGLYAWAPAEFEMIEDTGAHLVRITVTGSPHCGIYDGPPDNGRELNWTAYIRACHKLGEVFPTIYTDRDLLPALLALRPRLEFAVIVADPGVSPDTQIAGAVGVQYLWGTRYDMSAIYDDGWHPYLT